MPNNILQLPGYFSGYPHQFLRNPVAQVIVDAGSHSGHADGAAYFFVPVKNRDSHAGKPELDFFLILGIALFPDFFQFLLQGFGGSQRMGG